MPLLIFDPDLIRRGETLAARSGVSVEEAIRAALVAASDGAGFAEAEHRYVAGPEKARPKLWTEMSEAERDIERDKLRQIRALFESYPSTGVVVDDEFFDAMHR